MSSDREAKTRCEDVKGRESPRRGTKEKTERMRRMSLVPANRAAVSWWCQLDSRDDLSVWHKDTFLFNYRLYSQQEQTTG